MLLPGLFHMPVEPLLRLPVMGTTCQSIKGARTSYNSPLLIQYRSPNPYDAGGYQHGYAMPNVSQSLHPSYAP